LFGHHGFGILRVGEWNKTDSGKNSDCS